MDDIFDVLPELDISELTIVLEAIKHIAFAGDGFGLVVKRAGMICMVNSEGLLICGKECMEELQRSYSAGMLSPSGQNAVRSYLLTKKEAYNASIYGNNLASIFPMDIKVNGERFRLELVKLT